MGPPHNKQTALDTLEEKINKVINTLHDVKAMGVNITIEQRTKFRQLVTEVSEALDEVKDSLIETVADQLSPKQIGALMGDTATEEKDDETFEMEWDGEFGRCFNLVNNIRIYRQKISLNVVDSLTLAIVLTDCNRVQSELQHYARLVISQKIQSKISEDKNTRVVKYRKNKTENLSVKLSSSQAQNPARRSLMKHLSVSMLKMKL